MSVEFRTDSFASAEARAGFLASSGVGRSRWPDRRDAPNALRLALEERTEPFLYADRNVPGTGGRLQLGGVMMRNDPSELERVLQHAADLIVNAVAAQGPRALENPRSSTIYHE